MTHPNPHDTARNNVLAAALALQQVTRTAANIIPVPGTDSVIAIGTREWIVQNVGSPPAGVEAQAGVPPIGRLLDEFSALPVLWGLNEPGALVRHSDVFKMLVNAGKTYLAPAQTGSSAQDAKGEQAGWGDQFGNVWPLGAYSSTGKPNYHDAHKRGWQPLYRHSPAAAQGEQADEVRDAALEEAAQLCETEEIPFDIEVWRNTTKQGMSGKTALALAERIRALKRAGDTGAVAAGGQHDRARIPDTAA